MGKRLVLIIAMFFSGCGLFSPRENFEIPDPNVNSQPFSFESILDSIGEKFEKNGYEDVFIDSLIYQDMNSGVFSKKDLVSHLQQVQLEYKSMVVTWYKGEILSKKADTLILTNVNYKIDLNSGAENAIYTGRSDFTFAKNNQWQIVKWVDYPSLAEKSIFSPLR